MDFLLSNSRSHCEEFLEVLRQYPTMLESIDNVLDVGCGQGFASHWWANVDNGDEDNPISLDINVTAIDSNADAFDDQYAHENINFINADILDHQLDNAYYVVWAHSVLHQSRDPLEFLHKMNKCTNLGGMLCLTFPTTINNFYGEPDYRVYSEAPNSITIVDLIHMLVLSGFNCDDGYFIKQPNSNIINALVYKDSEDTFKYGEKTLYDYTDFLPEACKKQLNKFGYLTNKDLLLYWIDGTLIDYSKV